MAHKLIRGKLVIVGDNNTGKTCLFTAYAKDQCLDAYVPKVFEGYVAQEVIEGSDITVDIALWDTIGGTNDYERLLSYPDSDLLLLCYSIDNRDSMENVEEKWIPEVRHFCPNVPIILIGNKKDLRNDMENLIKSHPSVTYEEGYKLSQKIGAYEFIECSSKTRESVNKVFQTAARIIKSNKRRRYICTLL